jgi:hypothetical protein
MVVDRDRLPRPARLPARRARPALHVLLSRGVECLEDLFSRLRGGPDRRQRLNDYSDDDGPVGAATPATSVGSPAPGHRPRPTPTCLGPACVGVDPAVLTGGNFQLAEDDTTWTAAAYGSNYQHLQRVKADYDPDNLFRVHRNIAPAGMESGG